MTTREATKAYRLNQWTQAVREYCSSEWANRKGLV